LLQEGRIVLIRGKVDVRNDKAGIIANVITNELPVRADSIDRTETLKESLPDYNAMGGPSSDLAPDDEDADFSLGTDEIVWTPTYNQTPPPRLTPSPATNGNGSDQEEAKEQPPAGAPLRRTLHIRFSLTEDARLDAERMDNTLSLLTEFPGEDYFTVTIFNAQDEISIIFPQRKTRYCPKLVEGLQRLLGDECLTVERS